MVAYGRLRSPICREREPRICLSRSGTGRTVAEAVRLIPDAIRYAFGYHEADYARHLHQDVALTQQQGFELVRLRNFWPGDQYKGISSLWRDPAADQLFEVQFHTEVSYHWRAGACAGRQGPRGPGAGVPPGRMAKVH